MKKIILGIIIGMLIMVGCSTTAKENTENTAIKEVLKAGPDVDIIIVNYKMHDFMIVTPKTKKAVAICKVN